MTRPRVVFVQSGHRRAGAETVLLAHARSLRSRGVEVTVATLSDGPFVEELRAAGMEVHRLPEMGRLRTPWRAVGSIRALRSLLRTSRPDIVHAVGEKMSVLCLAAARGRGRTVVAHLHDGPHRTPTASLAQAMIRALLPRAVVVPSHAMAAAFADAWRLASVVVPNGVELDRLPPPCRVFPDGPEGPVVGMFGRIDHWKGQDVFTRAAAEVARRHAGAQFVVVGGDFYQTARTSSEDIRRLADDLGIGTRFHVLGDRPDAVSLMGGCTVVAHCSRSFEPFGVVVVEAMLMGAAVVATRTGGPEEILDAASGVLVPPDDVAALAEAVDRLLGDPLSRAGLVSEARARARALFSADASADALLDAYDHFRGGRARCLPDNMEQ